MNFGMIMSSQSIAKKSCVIWIHMDGFIVHIKTKHIAKDVEKRFDPSNYKLERHLSKGKNKKVISLIKDELDRKTMKEFVGLKAKTYRYLIDDNDESKKQKVQKMCNKKKT